MIFDPDHGTKEEGLPQGIHNAKNESCITYTLIPLVGDLMAIMALLQNLRNHRGNVNVGRNLGLEIPKYAFNTL